MALLQPGKVLTLGAGRGDTASGLRGYLASRGQELLGRSRLRLRTAGASLAALFPQDPSDGTRPPPERQGLRRNCTVGTRSCELAARGRRKRLSCRQDPAVTIACCAATPTRLPARSLVAAGPGTGGGSSAARHSGAFGGRPLSFL
jgi:hypothetical protein